jgi:G3E family GTPase
MAVPILLVTGFLGAGKTTLVNRLLCQPQGRRLAAVVNDFGAIDIDAALLGSVSDGVISLKNGCICCSLQGDLLATLASILRRDPAPDGIVIETSGVSNPAAIIAALLDPVIWKAAALDAVICVVDADQPDRLDDGLCRAQLDAADYVALSKIDLVDPTERDRIRGRLRGYKPDRSIHDMVQGMLPAELLFSADLHGPRPAPPREPATPPGFQSLSWSSDRSLSAPRFQALIGRLSPLLIRAKGILRFEEQPGEPMLFQLAGTRATIGPAPTGLVLADTVQLVFIARRGMLDEVAFIAALEACRAKQ